MLEYIGSDRGPHISCPGQTLVSEMETEGLPRGMLERRQKLYSRNENSHGVRGGGKMSEHSSGYASDAKHYQALSEQPIEIMQKLFSAEQLKGFLLGNVIKYSLRCGLKDNPAKEMQKVANTPPGTWMSQRAGI